MVAGECEIWVPLSVGSVGSVGLWVGRRSTLHTYRAISVCVWLANGQRWTAEQILEIFFVCVCLSQYGVIQCSCSNIMWFEWDLVLLESRLLANMPMNDRRHSHRQCKCMWQRAIHVLRSGFDKIRRRILSSGAWYAWIWHYFFILFTYLSICLIAEDVQASDYSSGRPNFFIPHWFSTLHVHCVCFVFHMRRHNLTQYYV